MKIIEAMLVVVIVLIALYVLGVVFMGLVSWIWGIEPQHLLPGMLPYAEWGVK